jgi:mono/diheme cytochrome c family protein
MSRKHKKQQHRSQATKPASRPSAPAPPDVNDLRHEPPEPATQRGSIPILLIAAMVVLFYWADMYVVTHGADLGGKGGAFPVTVYDPYRTHAQLEAANPETPEEKMFKLGRTVYSAVGCVACHQSGGAGVPGQFPPLAGSEWVLTENPARIIRIILNGFTGPVTVRGQAFNNTMPPLGSALDEKSAAAVLTYIRNAWGNKASPVTPEQVAKVRQEIGGRTDMFTAPELEQVPVPAAQ